MPTYSGTFPLVAQGQPVTVKLDGVELTDPAPGNVGSSVRGGQLYYSYEYAAGNDDTTLAATVQTSAGLLTAYLELDNSASIAQGGGGGGTTESVSRGTLCLKASCVDADASTEEWSINLAGQPLALILDTDRQGSDPIPVWAQDDDGVFSIIEQGAYLVQFAAIGSVTYDVEPATFYFDSGLDGPIGAANWGWNPDGTDDSEAFTFGVTTALAFGRKDSPPVTITRADLPLLVAGALGYNFAQTTDNPLATISVRASITKIASGTEYTEADFS
jgi:hypothetical protein